LSLTGCLAPVKNMEMGLGESRVLEKQI